MFASDSDSVSDYVARSIYGCQFTLSNQLIITTVSLETKSFIPLLTTLKGWEGGELVVGGGGGGVGVEDLVK